MLLDDRRGPSLSSRWRPHTVTSHQLTRNRKFQHNTHVKIPSSSETRVSNLVAEERICHPKSRKRASKSKSHRPRRDSNEGKPRHNLVHPKLIFVLSSLTLNTQKSLFLLSLIHASTPMWEANHNQLHIHKYTFLNWRHHCHRTPVNSWKNRQIGRSCYTLSCSELACSKQICTHLILNLTWWERIIQDRHIFLQLLSTSQKEVICDQVQPGVMYRGRETTKVSDNAEVSWKC